MDNQLAHPLREAGKAAIIPPERGREGRREYDRQLYQAWD